MASDAFDSRDVPNLLRVQVCLSDQMVLDIAEQEAVLAFSIDVMADTLSVVELSLAEVSLNVADLAVSDLLDERVRIGIQDQESIVR